MSRRKRHDENGHPAPPEKEPAARAASPPKPNLVFLAVTGVALAAWLGFLLYLVVTQPAK